MGNQLCQPVKNKQTTYGKGKNIIFAASAMQGWDGDMEDIYLVAPDLQKETSVFGVFDGHGGKEVAFFVENHFLEELEKNINYQEQNFEQALKETFLKMDELLLSGKGIEIQRVSENFPHNKIKVQVPGCCANVAIIHKNILYVANAGDSRAVLCRNNTCLQMSIDHKPENPEERKRIEKAGGRIFNGRIFDSINISRAIGDLEYKENIEFKSDEQIIIADPDIQKVQLGQNDRYKIQHPSFLILGTDGVFEILDNAQIIEFINQRINNQLIQPQFLGQLAEDLLDTLLAPDPSSDLGCDNMTVVIIYFK